MSEKRKGILDSLLWPGVEKLAKMDEILVSWALRDKLQPRIHIKFHTCCWSTTKSLDFFKLLIGCWKRWSLSSFPTQTFSTQAFPRFYVFFAMHNYFDSLSTTLRWPELFGCYLGWAQIQMLHWTAFLFLHQRRCPEAAPAQMHRDVPAQSVRGVLWCLHSQSGDTWAAVLAHEGLSWAETSDWWFTCVRHLAVEVGNTHLLSLHRARAS